jgi:hypothetical protein
MHIAIAARFLGASIMCPTCTALGGWRHMSIALPLQDQK